MKLIKFIYAMFLSFIPGFFGMIFSPKMGSDAWYNLLHKSELNPSNGIVFAVVWNVLYILLGFAFYLVIINKNKETDNKLVPYSLFFLHLFLNGLWSYMFFGLHLITVSMLLIISLIVVAFFMQRAFRKEDELAQYLVWPYILWLIFALYLNSTLLFLN